MGKIYFTKCFACFSGYQCGKTPRLSRKKKKLLKKHLKHSLSYTHMSFMEMTSRCDIAQQYKHYKNQFFIGDFIKHFKKELEIISNYCEESGEQMFIDEKGRLCWYWEYDNDFGGESGIMPFCYSEKEAGRTWAFSEVKRLIRFVQGYPDNFVFPKQITNDRQLLKYLNTLKFSHEK